MTHCGDLRLFVRVKTSEKKKRSEIACVNLQSECREGSEFFGFFSLHNTPRSLSRPWSQDALSPSFHRPIRSHLRL